MKKWIVAAAAACAGALPAIAQALAGYTTIYSGDFENGDLTGWTYAISNVGTFGTEIVPATSGPYAGQRFLGQLGGDDTVYLNLRNPFDGPVRVFLGFDAYFIRSWDGIDTTPVNGVPLGPDVLGVRVEGGPTLLDATFSIGAGGQPQSYCPFAATGPCPPTWAAAATMQLGYTYQVPVGGVTTNAPMDMVFTFGATQSPGFLFEYSGSILRIAFHSRNLQVRPDLAGTPGVLADESWGLDSVRVEVSPVPEPAGWAFAITGLVLLAAMLRRNG